MRAFPSLDGQCSGDGEDARAGAGRGEIAIWLAVPEKIQEPAAVARLESLLDDEETAAMRRFRFERDWHTYLVAHALLRTALSRHVRCDPKTWAFQRNDYGRPEVVPAQQPAKKLSFSLSHTRGLAACVVAAGCDVGVDVESLDREIDSLGFARSHFAPEEIAELERTPPPSRHAVFLEMWTLKEAWTKARGLGLSIPLDSFFFTRDAAGEIVVNHAGRTEGGRWTFALTNPTPGHQLALAVRQVAESEA
jgi:4'-phosphopantetheinyl transferase